MSHWIEFHASHLKRLQKFSDLRKDLQLSVNETLGFLGSFWCEVIELAESGDISGWSPEYVCERVGSSLSPDRVWNALVKHRWVDKTAAGRFLVHDWLDYAGIYLRNKYASRNREKLVEIWLLHGRLYGKQEDVDGSATTSQLAIGGKPIAPKGVGKGKGSGSSSSGKRGGGGKPQAPIPDDWQPTPETAAWCVKNKLPPPETERLAFVAYWLDKGTARADWQLTFRKWMTSPYRKDRPNGTHGQQSGYESATQRNGRRFNEELGKIAAGIGSAGGDEVLPLLPEAHAGA